jgi:hypothetical protein
MILKIILVIIALLIVLFSTATIIVRNKINASTSFEDYKPKLTDIEKNNLKNKKNKDDNDLEKAGIDANKVKKDEEILVSAVSDDTKNKDQVKRMIKAIFRDFLVEKAIEGGLEATEKAIKKMRSNRSMKELLGESNFAIKEGLQELDSIDFSKIPDGPKKTKLMQLIEDAKNISNEILDNSTFDKLMGTSDLSMDDVPTSDNLDKITTEKGNPPTKTPKSEYIDHTSGSIASKNLEELSEKLSKNFDELHKMKSFMKTNNIKLTKFKKNLIVYHVDNAISSVKHFTDTKLFVYMRRLKQLSGFGKSSAQVGKELSERTAKGAKFISNVMNSSLGKSLKNVSKASTNVSKTASKKVSKEVLSEAGGMGIGMIVALGVEIFAQMIESGSVDSEQLKQVMKEEAIAMAIEVGIVGTIAVGVAAATGTSVASAFSATAAGPVGFALAAAAIAGAALDASPVGEKFANVLLAKDLHAIKNDYDKVYTQYYSYNDRGLQRNTIRNWAKNNDIVIEGNFLDLDSYGYMSELATLEFAGYEEEYFEKNNLIVAPNTVDVFYDIKIKIKEDKLRRLREEKNRSEFNRKTRKLLLYSYNQLFKRLTNQTDLKKIIEIHKTTLKTLRVKTEAMKKGSYNSSQRILLTLALKKLGVSKTTIKQLVLPQYGD